MADTRLAGRAGHDWRREAGKVKAETHDMAADGAVMGRDRQAATRSSFTGASGSRYTAWCHARIMQALGWHSRGTTARVKAVDHHDTQVGSGPVGGSADQVQGIQGGPSSLLASE